MKFILYIVCISCSLLILSLTAFAQTGKESVLKVKKTEDFDLKEEGLSPNWEKTDWFKLNPLNLDDSREMTTRTKILYSDTGLYFLYQCNDQKLTATMDADNMALWKEDVVELFIWPDETSPKYFEYELSPLNHQLTLLITDKNGYKTKWLPFDYETEWNTRHVTSVEGGNKESGAAINQWTAKIFIPYQYLQPMIDELPTPGTRWRANFYRIDYDKGQILFAWQPVSKSFHEYHKFGTIEFE